MRILPILLVLTLLATPLLAQTNQSSLFRFRLLEQPAAESNQCLKAAPAEEIKQPFLRLRMERSPEEQLQRSRLLGDKEPAIAPPTFTLSQSARLAQSDLTDFSDAFALLNQFVGLFNFNAVYTYLKGESGLKASMALQLVLVNFAIKERYDVEMGPAYVTANGQDLFQWGATIKIIETPRLGAAAEKSFIPAKLSRFYFYLGVGTTCNDWDKWNASIGVGTQLGK